MKCIYCQSEMRHSGFSSSKDIVWMCAHYKLKPMVRVDHYYNAQTKEPYQIKLIVWRPSAQFPYDITLDLINKTCRLFHLPDAPKIIDYNNDYEWAKCLERINNKEPIFTLDRIPENINPETANQFLDRCLKLLSFY